MKQMYRSESFFTSQIALSFLNLDGMSTVHDVDSGDDMFGTLSKCLSICTALCALFSLTGCLYRDDRPVGHEFDGVKSALDRQSTVSILFVHGMGGYSEGDPHTLIDTMACELNLYRQGPGSIREIHNPESCSDKLYGCLTRQDYRGYCTPYHVRVYVLDWRPATQSEKCIVICTDEHSCQGERASALEKMRKTIVDNGLGDSTLYLSHLSCEMQFPVAQSIRWIHEDSKNDPCHEIVVVGWSLGSTIVLDTLDNMRGFACADLHDDVSENIANSFIQQLCGFFMLSNNYPIFQLGVTLPEATAYSFNDCQPRNPREYWDTAEELQTDCDSFCWNWQVTTLGRFLERKRTTSPYFRIVSVNDPNDILGFAPNDYYVPSPDGCSNAFINAEVRNVRWSLFGLSNPAAAHSNYGRNERVLGWIIYGVHTDRGYPCCWNGAN